MILHRNSRACKSETGRRPTNGLGYKWIRGRLGSSLTYKSGPRSSASALLVSLGSRELNQLADISPKPKKTLVSYGLHQSKATMNLSGRSRTGSASSKPTTLQTQHCSSAGSSICGNLYRKTQLRMHSPSTSSVEATQFGCVLCGRRRVGGGVCGAREKDMGGVVGVVAGEVGWRRVTRYLGYASF